MVVVQESDGTGKRKGETKISKREGKLGQGVGALKKGGGLEPPYEFLVNCFSPVNCNRTHFFIKHFLF